MNRVELLHWAAWAPGIATQEEWQPWARAPQPPSGGGAPDVRFLPSLQRRRCDALSRSMLEVAHACCPEPLLAEAACVFASRYGPLGTTVDLLRDLATPSALSPARFAHSVHNAPRGSSRSGRGTRSRRTPPPSAWPDALEFPRWWVAGEPKLCVTRGPRTWVWSRRV